MLSGDAFLLVPSFFRSIDSVSLNRQRGLVTRTVAWKEEWEFETNAGTHKMIVEVSGTPFCLEIVRSGCTHFMIFNSEAGIGPFGAFVKALGVPMKNTAQQFFGHLL